jgi:hypothetical protein
MWVIPRTERRLYGNNHAAIMYAQYFPKDQGDRLGPAGGHRHDWEEVIVWANGNGNPTIAMVSQHGDYKAMRTPSAKDSSPRAFWDGVRVKVSYFGGVTFNNSFHFSSKLGANPPIVSWDRGEARLARTALTDRFGGPGSGPKVMNKGNTFMSKIRKSWEQRSR